MDLENYRMQRPPYPDNLEECRREIDRLNAKLFHDAAQRGAAAIRANQDFKSVKGTCRALQKNETYLISKVAFVEKERLDMYGQLLTACAKNHELRKRLLAAGLAVD